MKQLILAAMFAFALTSCKNEVPSAPIEPPSVPASPAPSVPEKPKPEVPQTQTSVEMNKDGVNVETKNGENKTDVSVKNGKPTVDVKMK